MLLMLMSFLSWADLLYTVFMCVYVRASIYVVVVDVAAHALGTRANYRTF